MKVSNMSLNGTNNLTVLYEIGESEKGYFGQFKLGKLGEGYSPSFYVKISSNSGVNPEERLLQIAKSKAHSYF